MLAGWLADKPGKHSECYLCICTHLELEEQPKSRQAGPRKGKEGKGKGGHTLSVGGAHEDELARRRHSPVVAAWKEGREKGRGQRIEEGGFISTGGWWCGLVVAEHVVDEPSRPCKADGGFFFFIFKKIKISKIYIHFGKFKNIPRSPYGGDMAQM